MMINTMTPPEIPSLRKAHLEFKNLKLSSKRPMDDRDLHGFLQGEELIETSINLRLEAVSGFTRAGMLALSQLAGDLRSRSGLGARSVSRQSLAKALAQLAIASWAERPTGPLTDRELAEFDEKISAWFASQDLVRTHYIPCTVNAWPTEAFAIGPVHFYAFNEIPVEELGLKREEVWPVGEGAMSSLAEIYIGDLLRIAEMRNAGTIAEVSIPGREKTQSNLTADIAGLKNEHVAMLHAIDMLSQLSNDHARWFHLPAPTRELVAELERHERAESTLLRNLFYSKP